ncbi:MAG TPA: class I SAM-dependent methyltransferase [Pyrinomonadaceae bacterium]
MSKLVNDVSGLSPDQRAVLELRLKQMRSPGGGGSHSEDIITDAISEDDENLVFTESVERVDGLLSKFYGRFPWPWPTMKFEYLEDPYFETVMLNQDIGDWKHQVVPKEASIWVAGCGTNQAIFTALKFPKAKVIGSDVSAKSLEICAENARQLGLTNLELKEESINHVTYKEQFDYVISTGVIHHNADPRISLDRLVAALKPDGVMELLVYNRYHRTVTSAFQKAVRIFGEGRGTVDFEADFAIAKKIAGSVSVRGTLEKAFIQYMDYSESDFADLLIQPVEHSYTVESFDALGDSCGLEMLYPSISLYVKSLASTSYNLEFTDPELQELYDKLPDVRRWQVTNLIMQDKSPMLWFYFQRKDSAHKRKSEAQLCEEFLDTRFKRHKTTQRSYLREADGTYVSLPESVIYPPSIAHASVSDILDAVDTQPSMREVFRSLNLEPTFQRVNEARLKLTTRAFPYLRAIN